MATLPVQRTWTVNELVTASMLNDDVRDAINFFLNKPSCFLFNSAALSIANATTTYVTFNSEQHDNDNIHSTAASLNRMTIVTPGVYSGTASASFTGSAGGSTRSVLIRLNGTTVIREIDIPRNGSATTTVTLAFGPYKLVAGNYLEVGVYHDSGGALNVSTEAGITWESVG